MQKMLMRDCETDVVEQQQRVLMLPKNLLFLGGAKGIGKSSLLKHVREYRGLHVPVFHTGSLFLEMMDLGLEREADNMLLYRLTHFNGVVDTHYAGKKQGEFVSGMPYLHLQELSRKREDLRFVLVDSTLDDVMERIEHDNRTGRRVRTTNREIVGRELELNRQYFTDYMKWTGKPGSVIMNTTGQFDRAVDDLYKEITRI